MNDPFRDFCNGCGMAFEGATQLAGDIVEGRGLLCAMCIQKDRVKAAKLRDRRRERKIVESKEPAHAIEVAEEAGG